MTTKKEKKTSPSSSPENNTGWTDAITILPGKDENGFQIIKLFGYDIRALIEGGEPWFVVADLSKMFGIHETTIPKRIDNNPEDFEGWYRLTDVTSPRRNLPGFENLNQSLLLVNEQAVYLIMGGLSSKRIKNLDAKEMVRQFKRAFPELMKMFRNGEVVHISQIESESHSPLIADRAYPIISDCFDIAGAIHKHFGVDKSIATIHLLNGYKPEIIQSGHSGNIEPILQLLPPPAVDPDEAYLNATTIGRIYGLSNRTVNNLLQQWGYQVAKTRVSSDGSIKPDGWKPTTLGYPHGSWKMNSDGHNGGKMYVGVQWRWKASILEIFDTKLGIVRDPNQVTFKSFGFGKNEKE
jgi:hypothetical protein